MKTLVLYRHTEEPLKDWVSIFKQRDTDQEERIEYDENAPCIACGLPVTEASMSGTRLCPWCDMGICRFDDTHRVDMEGFGPDGKMRPSSHHYKRCHSEKLGGHGGGG